MPVHIVKLAVGADAVDDITTWQLWQIEQARMRGLRPSPVCGTRSWPKRKDEVLAGGSLYWVVRGAILVRQRIIAIDDVTDDHGARCGLYLDPCLVRTEPRAKRPFQGWRYLEPKDAPPDLAQGGGDEGLPEDMRRKLAELGAW